LKERVLDLEEFVDEIYADYKNNSDTKYVFFLGAGCSKSSGISLASELAEEWYEKLKSQTTKFNKFNEKYKINDDTNIEYGKLYFDIFETLFPTPLMQQKEIQRITNEKGVNPSLGYYTLASLMQKPPFNTVITTNFDNLIQDALIYRGKKRALVISHEDLAQFIERDETPMITKIHGDAHMHPFNNKKETKKIPKELKGAIQGLFTNAKVIFIGYGGNDKSIANLLNGCDRIDQVYWFGSNQPKEVALGKWWKKSKTKAYIKERDFDRIMNTLQAKFEIKKPNFRKIAKKLKRSYKSSVKNKAKEIIEISDDKKTYLDYYTLAYNYQEMKEYEKAIEKYKISISINPKYASSYNNLGSVYAAKNEHEKAIKEYQKAIDINSTNDICYFNMGLSYAKMKEYKKAIELYNKAIDLNSMYEKAYYHRGLVYDYLGEYKKAIDSYEKAIEINPNNEQLKKHLSAALKMKNNN